MSAFVDPTTRRRPPRALASRTRFIELSVTAAAGIAVGMLMGILVAGIPGRVLEVGVGAAAAATAIGLGAYAYRSDQLFAPLSLMGIPLMMGLAAAMTPLTKIFTDWSAARLAATCAIALAPIAGSLVYSISSSDRQVKVRGERFNPYLLVGLCVGFTVLGGGVLIYEFVQLGNAPLLASNVNASRVELVTSGPLHLLTEMVPVALIIAAWARFAVPAILSPSARRVLEIVLVSGFTLAALQGGRVAIVLPAISVAVVALSRPVDRRTRVTAVVVLAAALAVAGAVFVGRAGQAPADMNSRIALFTAEGERKDPATSVASGLIVSLGQNYRTLLELREARLGHEPATTTLWALHRYFDRAVNPEDIAGNVTRRWITATYAAPWVLDYGLGTALVFGFLLGLAAQFTYSRYRHRQSRTWVWVYASLAPVFAMAFYSSVFTQYVFPWVDLVLLVSASRLIGR